MLRGPHSLIIPRGGLVPPGGGLIPLGGGLAPQPPVGGIVWWESGAELIDMMGHGTEPTSAWRFIGTESTVQDLQPANNDLTVGSLIVQGEFNIKLGSKVARLAESSSNDMRLTGPDALDIGLTDSLAILLILELTGDSAGHRFFGKNNATPGYWIDTAASGGIVFTLDDTVNQDVETLAEDHRDKASHILAVFDRNADNVQVHTQLGSTAGQAINVVALTNAVAFVFGQLNLNAAGYDIAGAAVWVGAGAEGLNATHLSNLRSEQGF